MEKQVALTRTICLMIIFLVIGLKISWANNSKDSLAFMAGDESVVYSFMDRCANGEHKICKALPYVVYSFGVFLNKNYTPEFIDKVIEIIPQTEEMKSIHAMLYLYKNYLQKKYPVSGLSPIHIPIIDKCLEKGEDCFVAAYLLTMRSDCEVSKGEEILANLCENGNKEACYVLADFYADFLGLGNSSWYFKPAQSLKYAKKYCDLIEKKTDCNLFDNIKKGTSIADIRRNNPQCCYFFDDIKNGVNNVCKNLDSITLEQCAYDENKDRKRGCSNADYMKSRLKEKQEMYFKYLATEDIWLCLMNWEEEKCNIKPYSLYESGGRWEASFNVVSLEIFIGSENSYGLCWFNHSKGRIPMGDDVLNMLGTDDCSVWKEFRKH